MKPMPCGERVPRAVSRVQNTVLGDVELEIAAEILENNDTVHRRTLRGVHLQLELQVIVDSGDDLNTRTPVSPRRRAIQTERQTLT